MCDPATLLRGTDVLIVGFIGNRRSTEEANQIDEFDFDVIGEFRQYPGILSYSSMELIPNQWANLVVHQEVGDREAWRRSAVHIEAAEELSPRVFHSVRIHNGRVLGGPDQRWRREQWRSHQVLGLRLGPDVARHPDPPGRNHDRGPPTVGTRDDRSPRSFP